MKKIVSFGDSFMFGSELANNRYGDKAWPGLIAEELECDYQTEAVPGCGNDHIARQIYSYFSENTANNTLAVINWTWMGRWDFYVVKHETWITLGPTCVPEQLQSLVDKTESHRIIDFYNDYADSSILWNKFRNLQTIYAVQKFLDDKGVANVQTYMDYLLFDQQWHAPDYVKELQRLVQPEMQLFNDKNFLDWSKEKQFDITEQYWHPLEEAHRAAADYWKEIYKNALKI
jgi:hypothetical protein